jgi:hypothetical protein
MITTPLTAAQATAAGVSRYAATPRITYIGNTGTVMNFANQYQSLGNDFALSPSVVPYEVSVGGPGDLRRPHFDTVTLRSSNGSAATRSWSSRTITSSSTPSISR